MSTFTEPSEAALRLAAFAIIFAVMALLEFAIPKRTLQHSKRQRWFTNIAIAGIDTLLVRLMAVFVIPLAAVAAAEWASANRIGLFHQVDLPIWLEWIVCIALLDLAIYGQHVASHKVPILWRLHQMHHADVDFDVTTAVRFHPVEIGLSMLWKIVVVIAIGPAAGAVVLFEVLLNGTAMFNHANVNLPRPLDRLLRLLLVTPDMHRVHHSVIRQEHDSNYGFNLSIWDRMFRTYTPQPKAGHRAMTIGLADYQSDAPTGLIWSLRLPFMRSRNPAQAGSQKTLNGK